MRNFHLIPGIDQELSEISYMRLVNSRNRIYRLLRVGHVAHTLDDNAGAAHLG
jgi:hypothetical protein